MMTIMATCIVPCIATTKKKLRITRPIFSSSGCGFCSSKQTHRLVGSR